MRHIVLSALVSVGVTVPGIAQTMGGFPFGNLAIVPALRQALLSNQRSYVLTLPDVGGGNLPLLQALLSRGIPARKDRDLGAQGRALNSAVLRAIDAPERERAPPCRLFSITSAVGFVGGAPPVILAVSQPCGTAVLARSRSATPPNEPADIEWSPQFGTTSFRQLLETVVTPPSAH
jgi:hypothetical protein